VSEVGSDRIVPFQTTVAPLRGRLVRISALLDQGLDRHGYPPPVAALVAEAMVSALALASGLKYDGIFTLQLQGDGPVALVVADVVSPPEGGPRTVRGYARFDPERLPAPESPPGGLAALTGRGWLAFIVDQGPHTERYQGVVELSAESLVDSIRHYFRQSEQLATGLTLAVAHGPAGWRAGALLLQRLPEAGTEEDWHRAMSLMATLGTAELLDPALGDQTLLWRLFHEEGVRVWPDQTVAFGCRCSRERLGRVLATLPAEDLAHLRQDREVVATCEFCNTTYRFSDFPPDP
jgi:molecular chaperone Hsp33